MQDFSSKCFSFQKSPATGGAGYTTHMEDYLVYYVLSRYMVFAEFDPTK